MPGPGGDEVTTVAKPIPGPASLRHTGYWSWSAGAQLARLPVAMGPLAFTALTAALTGSYAAGGAMVAAEAIAEVALAVPVGRALDRFGARTGMTVLLVARAGAYLGLGAAAVAGAPVWALIVLAAGIGALGAGVLGGFRALLTGVVGADLLPRAIAVNSMVVEGVIVGGPVLVGLIARSGAVVPVLAMAAASALAASLIPKRPTRARTGTGGGRPGGLAGWAFRAFAFGHVMSTVEVAALPLAGRLGGGPGTASLIVATLSGASVAGGLIYAATNRTGTARLATGLLVTLAAGSALVATGTGWPVLLVGVAVTGMCAAPLYTVISVCAETLVPEHRRAEGFALLNTAQGLGFGLGSLSLAVVPLRAVGALGVATALLAALVGVGPNPVRSRRRRHHGGPGDRPPGRARRGRSGG